jgi:predicted ferric reductase
VPEWQSASIWFCGPPAFGQALRKDLVANGLAPADFHQELFQMR